MSSVELVVGIEAGGSNSCVVCADLLGNVKSLVRSTGINPTHNTNGRETLQSAILEALTRAGRRPEDVRALVLGSAGIDDDSALGWSREYTSVSGLDCPMRHLNDAEVAHAGAFAGQPGIIAVSGTGSIVWGRTDTDAIVRNYDFAHYAHSAARHIAYSAVCTLLTGSVTELDRNLERATLELFQVKDLEQLQQLVQQSLQVGEKQRNRSFGNLGPAVTQAAEQGSPIARAACDKAVAELAQGIALVARSFRRRPVPVVLIGSVVNAVYNSRRLSQLLQTNTALPCVVQKPELPPVAGAVLLALRLANVNAGLVNLKAAQFEA